MILNYLHVLARWLIRIDWGCNLVVPGSNCHRCCAYTVLQTVQTHRVYNAVYGTAHYINPLKSFGKMHSPGCGLPSLSILPQCAESVVKQYSLTYTCVNNDLFR